MTLAAMFVEQFKNQTKTISAPHLAKKLDTSSTRDKLGDGYSFYYFSDGSSAGTKGVGSHFQIWEVKNADADV